MELLALDDYRPHRTGHAHCGACGHRWIIVVPDSRKVAHGLECPRCERDVGVECEYAIDLATGAAGR